MEGQYKYILILYRTGLRRLKISDGQEHFKAYNAVCAGGGYTAFMQFHNFLGYGQAQSGASGFSSAGGIQTIELFKYAFKLFLGNIYSLVFKYNFDFIVRALSFGGGYSYILVFIAVINCIAQQIVEDALKLIRIAFNYHIGLNVQNAIQMLLGQHGLKFIRELFQQIGRASLGKECRSRWSPYH